MSYLKNKINEFFVKVINLFTVLNEILDEGKKINIIQTRIDYIQITEYMNNIHIYEIFMNKKKLPTAILNMLIEELSMSKSHKYVKYAKPKRVMKLEEKKEEKEELKEKEKNILFGIGDIVKLTSDIDITDKIKIKKNQEFLKNFIIIDIDITGKKFTVKEIDGKVKIADVPLNHIRLVRTAEEERDAKKAEEKRKDLELQLLKEEEEEEKSQTQKNQNKTEKNQKKKAAQKAKKAAEEAAEEAKKLDAAKKAAEEAEEKRIQKEEAAVAKKLAEEEVERERKRKKAEKHAEKKAKRKEMRKQQRQEVVEYLKDIYEEENETNNKVNELINPLLISLKEKYSELYPESTIEFLQYGSRGEKKTAISGSDLEYYILFNKSTEKFIEAIKDFNSLYFEYISNKLHNNFDEMGKYHVQHSKICNETINEHNISELNNMLEKMKYTNMKLEGRFRPPNPEKPCHHIGNFTIENITENKDIDNFIKEIGNKIEFSLETPQTFVIGHDRIVKFFSEKYPLFKYLILFIKKDLMRDVNLSGTSIEIILLSFLEEHEEYINKDIGDDNNNTIINIIKDLLIYLENFDKHEVIRLKNYYNCIGKIIDNEELLSYFSGQLEKLNIRIKDGAQPLIMHPISLDTVWGGYPGRNTENIFNKLKKNCEFLRTNTDILSSKIEDSILE